MLKSIVRDLIYLDNSEFNPISNNQTLLHLKVPAWAPQRQHAPMPDPPVPIPFLFPPHRILLQDSQSLLEIRAESASWSKNLSTTLGTLPSPHPHVFHTGALLSSPTTCPSSTPYKLHSFSKMWAPCLLFHPVYSPHFPGLNPHHLSQTRWSDHAWEPSIAPYCLQNSAQRT